MEKKRMDYIPMWGRYLTMFRNAGLNDVQLGHLMRAMMEYHFEDKEPMDLEDKLEVATDCALIPPVGRRVATDHAQIINNRIKRKGKKYGKER